MGECGKIVVERKGEEYKYWAKIKKKESNRYEEEGEEREIRWSVRGKKEEE